ncbi:MAG: hypothetical protein P4M09_04755 [Devosia sp.]|nr:hypothetical protein [Devosia sp.]
MPKRFGVVLAVLLLLTSLHGAGGQMVSGAGGQRESVQSGYDSTWVVAPYWPGEWPAGFAVARRGVTVEGRGAMDKALPRSISCELPYRAVFNPWNARRNEASHVEFFSASKIIPLSALKSFRLDDGAGNAVSVVKGQVVEYLGYLSEGWFAVRINGKTFNYAADQSLFDDGKLTPLPDEAVPDDLWLTLKCANGPASWLLIADLLTPAADGDQCSSANAAQHCMEWIDGLWNAGRGEVGSGILGYGEAGDLADEDIRKGGASIYP